jgi:Poxvirus D5 protein-like
MHHKLIAFGCIAISATLAGLYGYMSADTVAFGTIRAASLCAVAIAGACCPAWASHHWSAGRYGQCAITWLVCVVCLAVTLGGGIGTIAGSADEATAERSKAITTAKDNRAEIERMQHERAKLDPRPIGTIKAELEAAHAYRAYKATNGCEPAEIATKIAREACGAFRKLEGELASAEEAARLDADLARLRAKDGNGPAMQLANPQAAAISTLLHIPIDDAVALYAFVASLALELAGMAAMMRADAPSPVVAPIAEHITLAPSPVAMLAGPFGNVKRFLLECLPRAKGQRVTLGAVYARYRRWCDDQKSTPLSAQAFAEEFKTISERVALRTKRNGTKIYCLDVTLVA